MSVVLPILLFVGVAIAGAVTWTQLRPDAVGRRVRERRAAAGLQGRLTEWLYWDAPLDRPHVDRLTSPTPESTLNPADRALQAVVRREALEGGVDAAAAHGRLVDRVKSPVAKAFLEGRMGRATRLHWRSRYRGPPALFGLWFYLIAVVRYGRRHLFLETLSAALQELRTA